VSGTLIETIERSPAVQRLLQRLEKGGALSLRSVCQPAQAFLTALLWRELAGRPVVLIHPGLKPQEVAQQDLETWLGRQTPADPATPTRLLFFPDWEVLPHESRLPHADVLSERLGTLIALTARHSTDALPCPIINTSVIALLQKTFAPGHLQTRIRTLSRGMRLNPLDLVEWLEDQGYESETRISKKGEMAMRGGIVDVFPLPSPWPVRLEFFGDELESLRSFDPVSQVSREEIQSVTLPPAGELGLLRAALHRGGSGAGGPIEGTLLDYLPANAAFIVSEPEAVDEQAAHYLEQCPPGEPLCANWDELRQRIAGTSHMLLQLSEEPSATPGDPPGEEFLFLPSLEAFRPVAEKAPDPVVAEEQRREFFSQMHRWLRQGLQARVFCNNEGERQRFAEIWNEYGLGRAGTDAQAAEPASLDGAHGSGALRLELGTVSRGFLFEEAALVVITDAEVFGRYRVARPRRLKSPHAAALRSSLDIDFSDLEEGDYVVHLEHGIGRYLGLQPMPGGAARDGQKQEECLVLEYAPREPEQPPPRLYVPVTEAHLISKYVGAGKARPPLNTLGGGRWARTKAQALRAVRDLAGEMLAIQAARASQPGHTFSPDTAWQREFEGAFLYEETPDQLRAIQQTKADMERPKPMDRLICGDVGFGKTEVAIRAAFKAVMEGRQVAVLVPTTVLAQQHWNTFRERMADYPIRVALLSRFLSRRAQQKTIADLAAGSADIVIGTHRLLQRDISFKNLGLVVIDEEQRFGVTHKERFKQLRHLVDVLTLSATPIPRTLYLALTGARDMSTIQTPPHDRLPVETIVTPYDERIIRDAILRELARGGQVFFLHNRVATIEAVADRLRALVPDARLVVGHGQMHGDELEQIMTRFVNGEANVLLSTTIIESGLDIPNANTIIIDRADRFGLSDLYQLRGRVGRYKHQAYAYLVIPRHARLLTDARKRIGALKQYSTLGSGFKIAMRDLEIRGAGNLLGAEQSGHITAVGFDLYCQLLKQSVAHLKGERLKPLVHVAVNLDFLSGSRAEASRSPTKNARPRERESTPAEDRQRIQVPRETWAYVESSVSNPAPDETPAAPAQRAAATLPRDYIPEPVDRIEVYRRLAQVTGSEELKALQAELRDRYGPLPQAAELLLQVTELKLAAASRNVTAIETRGDKLMLTRNRDFVTLDGKFPRLTKPQPKARLNEIRKLLQAL